MDVCGPAIILGLAGVAVHAQEILGGRPYFRDFHQVYVPAKWYLAERLRAGELPQWWPWDGGGSPLIPQPVFSVFHPTTLLYLLLPFWPAFTAQNLCGTWLALFGAYFLARTVGVSRQAATVSGLLYGLCGYLACLSEHQFMKLAAGTMPWYLAATVMSARRGGLWLLTPVLAMGTLLLAGDPQIAILSAAAGLCFALVRVRRKGVPRAMFAAIVSPVAGACLAAVQLVPSLAVLPDTERGRAMAAEKWAMGLRHLAGFLWPADFGAADWVRSTVFGWLGMGLVFASLAGWRVPRRRRLLVLLWGLVFLSTWLAFGEAGGLNHVARAVLPLWGRLRYPMKSLVLACLMLSLLAGLGMSNLSAARLRKTALAAALLVVPAGVAAALALGRPPGPLALVACGLLAGLALLWARRPWLAAGVVACHGVVLAAPLFLTAREDFYDPPPIARVLQQAHVGLTGGAFDRPFAPVTDPIRWAETNRAGAGGLGTSLGAVYQLPAITPSMPGSSWRILRLFDDAHREVTDGRLLGVYGVADVVLKTPVEERLRPQLIGADPDAGYSVVRLKHSLGRAYAAFRARRAATADDALAMVSASDFAPGHEVILEGGDADADPAASPDLPATPAAIEPRAGGDSVRVRASLSRPGFVVLNEAWFHGWTAVIDGVPATVLPANAFVRAVRAPPGDHEIVFRFETPGLRTGALISALTLIALLLAGLRLRRRPAAS
jgi:hypothetical protein